MWLRDYCNTFVSWLCGCCVGQIARASALACNLLAFVPDFDSRSDVACSVYAVRSCTGIWNICLEFIPPFLSQYFAYKFIQEPLEPLKNTLGLSFLFFSGGRAYSQTSLKFLRKENFDCVLGLIWDRVTTLQSGDLDH